MKTLSALIVLFLTSMSFAAIAPPPPFGDEVQITLPGYAPVVAQWDQRSDPTTAWGAWQYLAREDDNTVAAVDLGRPWEMPGGPWTISAKQYQPNREIFETDANGPNISQLLWGENFGQQNIDRDFGSDGNTFQAFGSWYDRDGWDDLGLPSRGSFYSPYFAETASIPEPAIAGFVGLGALLLRRRK
jgi:hypothetical protein